MLRRKRCAGRLTMISADSAPPCDRPNLSKDFLAGTAPDEWIPLRPPEWYSERNIELVGAASRAGLKYKAARESAAESQAFGGHGVTACPTFFSTNSCRPGSPRLLASSVEAV